ncbi:HAD domain-containing protein [Streptomyces sp. NY05-11A]|uniref:HAD domain-containing protein n=1 Tax=Streptomyces soliscabiei TaxID=588897 RepID=UPI0029B1DC2A|nr:HAD domain-containing protein [Streptomyces sp. NY05-11A]MDX2679402.1 HAD domain-containing protein [Streptomyces sp. NY05-11A]
MRTPYLLLDVDGILIPFPDAEGASPATHTRHDVVPTDRSADDPVTIWLNPAHGPLLMHVIRTGLVTPVWCTSWRHDATTLIGPLLGLPSLPHVDLPRPQITTSHPNGYLWKRDHVDTWLGDAPVIWIDDDFTNLDHEWAAERTARGQVTALVQPDPHVGLLAEHLVEVLARAALLPVARADVPAVSHEAEAA